MKRRGFTLIEMLIVVAVVAVLSAIAYPRFDELSRRSRIDGATRALVGSLRESRAMAIARQEFGGVRARAVGIRIDSPTRYTQIFDGDTDDDNGNDTDLRVVDNTARVPGLRITSPAPGTVIRFRRDGSTTAGSIVLADTDTSLTRTIRLTAGGQATLE